MTTLHVTNNANVMASVNAHFKTHLAAITRPSWLPGYTFVESIPQTGITPPAISVAHIDVLMDDAYIGRRVGTGETGLRNYALLDIQAWVSRSNVGWQAQLATLKAMIHKAYLAAAVIIISDYSTPASPSVSTYKVNLSGIEAINLTLSDVNPDIERSRFQIRYNWIQRSS